MRCLLALALLAPLGLGGCHKEPPPPAEPKPCHSNDDCTAPQICLAYECTDPRPGAIYTDPGNAVTPDKVKKDVEEKLNQEQQQRERKTENVE